ncbi:MAG: NusG domain II-containing protein [Oscillospiraceae bacterium]|nr:NusG domain II-containing protein [Oscillospiraceae bacterium]
MKKKLDINTILIGLVLVAAAGIYFWRNTTAVKGVVAVVRIDGTDKRQEISLEENGIHTIEDGRFIVTLEVQDEKIRFINSLCPDHLCEGYGFIGNEDEIAVCMPAGVAVVIE